MEQRRPSSMPVLAQPQHQPEQARQQRPPWRRAAVRQGVSAEHRVRSTTDGSSSTRVRRRAGLLCRWRLWWWCARAQRGSGSFGRCAGRMHVCRTRTSSAAGSSFAGRAIVPDRYDTRDACRHDDEHVTGRTIEGVSVLTVSFARSCRSRSHLGIWLQRVMWRAAFRFSGTPRRQLRLDSTRTGPVIHLALKSTSLHSRSSLLVVRTAASVVGVVAVSPRRAFHTTAPRAMNVTKDNIGQACQELATLLPTASFIAIDEEMTGIHMVNARTRVCVMLWRPVVRPADCRSFSVSPPLILCSRASSLRRWTTRPSSDTRR